MGLGITYNGIGYDMVFVKNNNLYLDKDIELNDIMRITQIQFVDDSKVELQVYFHGSCRLANIRFLYKPYSSLESNGNFQLMGAL